MNPVEKKTLRTLAQKCKTIRSTYVKRKGYRLSKFPSGEELPAPLGLSSLENTGCRFTAFLSVVLFFTRTSVLGSAVEERGLK